MLLKFLRKKKNMKRIMWVLAILIIPAFVIWGAGSAGRKRGKGPNYAGKIFGRKVSFDEYVDMWQVTRDYAIRTFGTNLPPELIDQLTWNRILLVEEAKREKILIKDSEVVERIVLFPVFQREGSFDKKLYKSMLGDSAKGFEEKIRDDIRISKLREKITSSVSVTDDELKEAYKKKFEKIKASYASIPFSDFEKDVKYQTRDLLDFYEKNRLIFRKPDEINIRYIEIPFSSFDKEVYITEENIKRHFEENLSDFKKEDSDEMPELTEEIKKEISAKLAMQRKKSLAEELGYKVLDKVLDKKNLNEVAHLFALETKETGFFSMREEIPGIGWSYEFTKRGFELGPEEISNILVKTDNGLCIIQLKEKKDSYIPGFAEARGPVTDAFIKDKSIKFSEKKAKKLFMEIGNKIKSGASFEDIMKRSGLEIKATPFIARDGYIPGLGPAREFVEACSSLKNNEIAGPVKMLGSWVVLRFDEYEGIDESKFLEERESFKENFLSRKKQESFNKYFEELKREANFVSYTLE